jgi:outer membrane protein OmpA-like peptidoglycan-associated protein/ABC-type nitrate/sulfonate/bicarbonate transport system substrate-binding protein
MMKGHTKIALGLLLIGVVILIGSKLFQIQWEKDTLSGYTDAGESQGKIIIGVDNWIGYFPLCSPVMKRRLYQQGYRLECIEDQADYAQRLAALHQGDLDLAVATVDSYLLKGNQTHYTSTIVAVLDESKGGDALLAWKDKLTSLEDLRQKKSAKIAFTPDSPSDHLIKAIAVHFDMSHLKQRQHWPVLTQGSKDALQRLLNKEVDAAVLWQPDVSKALGNKAIHLLLSTDQTQQLIVDILLAGKKMMTERPELIHLLLTEYFHTLKFYRDQPQELIDDVKKATQLKEATINTLLKGVKWQGLTENAHQWFGTVALKDLPEQELVETIQSSLNIFMEYGTMQTSPLPDQDPHRIISSHFIDKVYQQLGIADVLLIEPTPQFTPMMQSQWENLQQVGKLKIRPIIFASGTGSLTLEDKNQLDSAEKTLKHYPNFRILVRGHTSIRGDSALNKVLSQDRADAVVHYLKITHHIPEHRLQAIGYGGENPLPREANESQRAYNYRLPRVELILVTDKF